MWNLPPPLFLQVHLDPVLDAPGPRDSPRRAHITPLHNSYEPKLLPADSAYILPY